MPECPMGTRGSESAAPIRVWNQRPERPVRLAVRWTRPSRPLLGIGLAGDQVEVASDARDLPGAFTLHLS